MLFHTAKVPLKVFSILFKVHWACCDRGSLIQSIDFWADRNYSTTYLRPDLKY